MSGNDREDFSPRRAADIVSQSVGNLAVDIAGSVGTIDTNIAGQAQNVAVDISGSVGTIDTNIAGQAQNIDTEIAGQVGNIDVALQDAVDTVDTQITGQVGNVAVDLASQSLTQVGVDLESQSVGNLSVDLASSSVNNLGVDIESQSINNLGIDIQNQSVGDLGSSVNTERSRDIKVLTRQNTGSIGNFSRESESFSPPSGAVFEVRAISFNVADPGGGGIHRLEIFGAGTLFGSAIEGEFPGTSEVVMDNSVFRNRPQSNVLFPGSEAAQANTVRNLGADSTTDITLEYSNQTGSGHSLTRSYQVVVDEIQVS
jgi:hypothetical protein